MTIVYMLELEILLLAVPRISLTLYRRKRFAL